MSYKLKGISLFSGAGGMDVGFAEAGIETVIANELNPDASATYRKNHTSPILEGDILELFGEVSKHRGADVVFGGPPCQGFSVAGKMDPEDERSQHVQTFMDVVASTEPKAFVCENVKALATLAKWKGIRDNLIFRASKNYSVALLVLNAKDYGVPQSRERMFLIGIHRDLVDASQLELEQKFYSMLENRKVRAETVAMVLRRLGKPGTNSNKGECRAKITFAKSPVLRSSPYAGMLFNGAGRPIAANGAAPTLAASMGGNKTPIVDEREIFSNGGSFVKDYHSHLMQGGRPQHGNAPSSLRRLTVTECAALQSFPSHYEFCGKQSSQYRQIGNAVPCKLAFHVGASLAQMLNLSEMNSDALIAAE